MMHNALFSGMKPFYDANVSWLEIDVETDTSHFILHMLHQTTKPSSPSRETTLINTCRDWMHDLKFNIVLMVYTLITIWAKSNKL